MDITPKLLPLASQFLDSGKAVVSKSLSKQQEYFLEPFAHHNSLLDLRKVLVFLIDVELVVDVGDLQQLSETLYYSVQVLCWYVRYACVLRRTAPHSIIFNFYHHSILQPNQPHKRIQILQMICTACTLGCQLAPQSVVTHVQRIIKFANAFKIEIEAVNIKSETMKHYIYISISTPYLINIQLMFGSQTNMNHQRPYANFKEIQTNTSRLQFFSSLFNNNQITYLDPHKIYCVIQTERYTKIKEELSQSLRNQQSLEKVAYEMNLANIGLKKEIQIYTQQTQKLKASQRQMKQEYNNAIKASKQYEKSFLEFKCRANQNIFQQSTEIKSKLATKTYTNQYCQTQALLSQQEKAQENSIINNEIEVPQQEKVDQKLYELLRLEMDKFQQQFQAKVHEIEQAKLNIEKWQTENQSLREQNQNLKNKIVEREIQQQKLKIWKVNVNEFVSRIEQSITHPAPKHSQPLPSQYSNESVSYLKAEVLELRGKIVEMRNKMRRIDESIEIQGEINDDGAIGMLVRTSQKLKQLVKGIIADVEQI